MLPLINPTHHQGCKVSGFRRRSTGYLSVFCSPEHISTLRLRVPAPRASLFLTTAPLPSDLPPSNLTALRKPRNETTARLQPPSTNMRRPVSLNQSLLRPVWTCAPTVSRLYRFIVYLEALKASIVDGRGCVNHRLHSLKADHGSFQQLILIRL
jgi:hypothetical protein